MAKLFNRAKMTTATTGSGTVTLGSASNGFQTFAAAGVSNGDVVQYVIEEGANFEIGTGTYSSTGSSLTRSPTESSNSNAAITLAGQATVSITAVADDLNRLQHGGSDKVTVSSTGASVTGNLAVSGTVDGRDVASDGSKLDAIEANAKNDQTITAGGGLTGGGTGDVTISHSDTSSQASVNGSGRTYIQDITLDTYGHVTGLATATETVVNTDTNTTYSAGSGLGLSGTTFSHSDTSSQGSVNNSGATVIQDVTLDTYGHVTGLGSHTLTLANLGYTGATNANYITNNNQLTNGAGYTTFTANQSLNTSNDVTFHDIRADGGNLILGDEAFSSSTTYVGMKTSFMSGTNDYMIISGTSDGNTYISAKSGSDVHIRGGANTSNYEIKVYPDAYATAAGSTIITEAGGGLSKSSRTISHADTSSQASVNNSGRTYIQDITLDTYGHITGITSATETVVNTDTNTTNFNVQANGGTQVNISAGEEVNFINGNATTAAVTNQANPTVTFHHNDTSSQASVNNSSGTVIQDVTLDGYGHVTGLTSYNLDGRYYTESEADSRFVNVTGDTVTGDVQFNSGANIHRGTHSSGHLVGSYNNVGNNDAKSNPIYTIGSSYQPSDANLDNMYGIGFSHGNANFDGISTVLSGWGLYVAADGDARIGLDGSNGNIKLTGTVDGRDVSADGAKLDTIATNANYITNNNQLTNGAGYTTFTANQSLNTSSNPTFNQIYANDWFRVNGADGIYWQSYGGGFQMTDTTWVRVYNSKAFLVSNTCQAVTFNSTSDERYKKDIVKIDDALDKLHRLNGYDFTFKDTDKKSSGVIAQEVQRVMPQLVDEGDDGRLTVQYGNMVGLLIEAIKEQQTQIDDLKAEIQSMKS